MSNIYEVVHTANAIFKAVPEFNESQGRRKNIAKKVLAVSLITALAATGAQAGDVNGTGTNNTAAGTNAVVSGGSNNTASGNGSIVAGGTNNTASGQSSFVAGSNSSSTDFGGIAIGSRAVGNSGQAFGQSIAIGNNTNTLGNGSAIIGNQSTTTNENTFVLGSFVTTTQDNSVILGNNSTDKPATAVTGAVVGNTTLTGFAGVGSNTAGVVSVGSVGSERQVVNVASGNVSTSSTDAINGSQLYAVTNSVDRLNTNMNNMSISIDQQFGYVRNEIKDMDENLSAGIASAAAIENAPYIAGHLTYAVGASNFNSESAIGVSLRQTAANGKWSMSGGVSTNTQSEPLFRIGVSGVLR